MRQPSNSALVWLLMGAVAVVGSNSLALSPILGDVAADLGTTPVAIARASAAYGGATAASALALGRLIDRYGAERALVAGLAALAVAMAASAAANHWFGLALAQAGAGIAAGIVLPAAYALAAAVAPEGRSAETLGRVLTGWSVALVAGVPVSAAIAGAFSWRASYGLFAVALAGAALLFPRRARASSAASPIGLGEALRRPGVAALLSICLLFMTAFYGVYAFLGDHVRRLQELAAAQAGWVVLAYGVGFGLGSFADRALDRFGAGRLLSPVMAALALVYAALIPAAATLPASLAVATAWGAVNHLGLNLLVLGLTRAVPEGRGAVLALNSAVSYGGALLGALGFGLLYEFGGFAPVAGAAALCAALAAGLALSWKPRRSTGRVATSP